MLKVPILFGGVLGLTAVLLGSYRSGSLLGSLVRVVLAGVLSGGATALAFYLADRMMLDPSLGRVRNEAYAIRFVGAGIGGLLVGSTAASAWAAGSLLRQIPRWWMIVLVFVICAVGAAGVVLSNVRSSRSDEVWTPLLQVASIFLYSTGVASLGMIPLLLLMGPRLSAPPQP